ncbi:MAG TPA: PaaI family thioesterase [Pseudonocardia sp.]|nr:PaaI family thioesterase [Pseudonocardia sp.]
MTVTETAERMREIIRLTDERMALAPVEGALGLVMDDLDSSSLRLGGSVPLNDGRPDPVAMTALICVLTDTAAGLASALGRPYGDGGATVELRIDHLAPVHPDVRRLHADARQIHVGSGVALAEATLCDDRGAVLARAHGHFAHIPGNWSFPPEDSPHVPGKPLFGPAELGAALTLDPATDPLERTVALPEVLANPRRQIHGGVVVALAELAQRQVREAATSPGAAPPRLLSISVDYLRPADCDGSTVICRSEYTRHGKRFSTLRTELVRPDGRVAAIATGLWSAVD